MRFLRVGWDGILPEWDGVKLFRNRIIRKYNIIAKTFCFATNLVTYVEQNPKLYEKHPPPTKNVCHVLPLWRYVDRD